MEKIGSYGRLKAFPSGDNFVQNFPDLLFQHFNPASSPFFFFFHYTFHPFFTTFSIFYLQLPSPPSFETFRFVSTFFHSHPLTLTFLAIFSSAPSLYSISSLFHLYPIPSSVLLPSSSHPIPIPSPSYLNPFLSHLLPIPLHPISTSPHPAALFATNVRTFPLTTTPSWLTLTTKDALFYVWAAAGLYSFLVSSSS